VNLALYGGTFDPIHRAHLIVAAEAAEQFKLDAVWFVTAGQPPHKTAGSTTPYEHRQRMVELACAGDPRFHAPRLEEGAGASYTIRTIERVRAMLDPGYGLMFLIGADAFAEIGTWYRSAEVLAAVEFIVVSRPGYVYPAPAGARIHRLETLALPVSSSEIRRALEQGETPGELPDAVSQYIRAHGLYRLHSAARSSR
jgi:nicotinate-nucleotide adenylyltransferase